MEGGDIQILRPYELQFSDLLLLSSDDPPSSSPLPSDEVHRLELITGKVMENLGPTGPGLLAITGVPGAATLRRALLSLARPLALLDFEHRKRILKENGLGSDVPLKNLDRTVSPFTMQLKYGHDILTPEGKANQPGLGDCIVPDSMGEFQVSEFKNLRSIYEALGFRMIELGCRLARVCDRIIGGQELEQSLFESCVGKGRLIHYHSDIDNLILKENSTRMESTKRDSAVKSLINESKDLETLVRNNQKSGKENGTNSVASRTNLWQQWHYDYGIFTILTDPVFMLPDIPHIKEGNDCFSVSLKELPSPTGHSYLQVYHPNKRSVFVVKVSPDSFIIQVGESADILSKGRLCATLHSVSQPEKRMNLSRENFVVFLQPAWSKTFSLLNYPVECSSFSNQRLKECAEESYARQEAGVLTKEIYKIVPPLSARLKEGMTFAEFSRVTTKQYYSGSGLQSKG